jgi:HSP20 family protein
MKESTVPVTTEKPKVPATRDEERTSVPAVDIFEIADGLVVVADLPGVDKDHVDVRVENDVLTIKGNVKDSPAHDPLYGEYVLRNYFRQFELSEHVDQDKIRADMKLGVLTVQLPKKEKAKPKRIQVSVQ